MKDGITFVSGLAGVGFRMHGRTGGGGCSWTTRAFRGGVVLWVTLRISAPSSSGSG